MKKQLKPFGPCAKTRKASHIGADMNHLCPCRRNVPSPAGSARVTLVRRSEPPWFSVMPMPISADFLLGDRHKTRVIVARVDFRQPLFGDVGRLAQRRHRAVGHGDRAIDAALDLREHVGAGGARDMRAGLAARPRGSHAGLREVRSPSVHARPGEIRPRRRGGHSGRTSAAPADICWRRSQA